MKSTTKSLVATVAAATNAARTAAAISKTDWEAQRQEHWQRSHVKVISCKISADEHAELMRHCKAAHCTRYALLRLLIVQYLKEMETNG